MEDNLRNPFDNPFIQLLTRVGEMMLANFLFIICSLPVVTVGAAAAGMNKVVQNIVLDSEGGVAKTFFQAFRENFRQATVLWLAEVVIVAAAASYWLIIASFCPAGLAPVLNFILLVVVLLLLCVAVYLIPLMVRYENGLKQHLKNAVLLSVVKLPRTVGMVLLALIMPAIFYISVPLFIQTLFFWLMIGFSFISYMSHLLLKPVFKQLEEGNVGIMN